MIFSTTHYKLNTKRTISFFFFTIIKIHGKWIKNQYFFLLLDPHRWVYFLLHLKYSINCKSCRNMNNIITYCALNQMLNTIFDIKRIPCRANYTRYWLQKGICAWLMWSLHYNISQDLMKSKITWYNNNNNVCNTSNIT